MSDKELEALARLLADKHSAPALAAALVMRLRADGRDADAEAVRGAVEGIIDPHPPVGGKPA